MDPEFDPIRDEDTYFALWYNPVARMVYIMFGVESWNSNGLQHCATMTKFRPFIRSAEYISPSGNRAFLGLEGRMSIWSQEENAQTGGIWMYPY
jgi:hypothetical protein